MTAEPKSLQESDCVFANPDNCIDYLAIRRWPDGKSPLPYLWIGQSEVPTPARRLWQCSTPPCKRQFSIKVGTVMEDSASDSTSGSPPATWLVTNCKTESAGYEIARDVKVTQKSHGSCCIGFALRCRTTLLVPSSEQRRGRVEVDEAFIGGKMSNRHKSKDPLRPSSQQTVDANGVKHMAGLPYREPLTAISAELGRWCCQT